MTAVEDSSYEYIFQYKIPLLALYKYYTCFQVGSSRKSINFVILLCAIIIEVRKSADSEMCAKALPFPFPFTSLSTRWWWWWCSGVTEKVLTRPLWLPYTVLIISAEAVSFIYCIMREVFCSCRGERW